MEPSPVREQERTEKNGDKQRNSLTSGAALNDCPYFIQSRADKIAERRKLPQWLDHFNAKDLKNLFKCSMAVWIATLFILIDPTLAAFGQATFFGCILLFMIPCNGIVFVHLLGAVTMILGMAMGWAWGVISMKAALATRSTAETNARLAQLAAQAKEYQTNTEQATGQSTYTQVLIFDGFMLDDRVTITYFCMLGLFIYLVARIRVAAPKLALMQVFAIVVIDIFLTIGPLLPSFSGTIPSVLIKPAATAVGIGICCNVLFFPESTSHVVLEGMQQTLAPVKGFLEACVMGLKQPLAELDGERIQQTKAEVGAAYKGVQAGLGFLPLDISGGRWNAEDIVALQEPLRQVIIMFMGLIELQLNRIESKIRMEKLETLEIAMHDEKKADQLPETGHHHLVQILNLRQRFRHQDTERLHEESMSALSGSAEPLIQVCGEALDAVTEAVYDVNSRRWLNRPSADECHRVCATHEATLSRLKREQASFSQLIPDHLLGPHSHLFDKGGSLLPPMEHGVPLRGLFFGMILAERLSSIAEALNTLLSQVVSLEQQRTKTRLWAPTGLRHAAAWAFSKSSTPGTDSTGSTPEQDEQQPTKKKNKKIKNESKAQQQLDALRFHGGTKRSLFGKFLLALTHWLSNSEGMYALRVLIVSLAMALPAVLTSSAGFYYREKGLWALIMAQTGLVAYTADFVYGFLLRVLGTVLGGIFGMVCWYIGAGNGPGNSYGMAAVMALAIVLLMWGRLFAPPAVLQAVLLMASTTYLVVAYSWVDTHIPSYGNPGVGYSVFWRRTLLVLIGFTASAIVIFIPRPPSASRHYRRVLAGSLRNSKDLYALFVTSWPSPQSLESTDLRSTVETQIISTAETLSSILGPIALLKFEFSSSPFDAATLQRVTRACMALNQSLSQLLVYAPLVPADLRASFVSLTHALSPAVIGDLMAVLTLVEQSLLTGTPLPAMLPVPLAARALRPASAGASSTGAPGGAGAGGELVLTQAMVREAGFGRYSVLLSAFVQLLGAADELVWVVKGAVGETHLIDVEEPFLARYNPS